MATATKTTTEIVLGQLQERITKAQKPGAHTYYHAAEHQFAIKELLKLLVAFAEQGHMTSEERVTATNLVAEIKQQEWLHKRLQTLPDFSSF